jgi:hypothetical protein
MRANAHFPQKATARHFTVDAAASIRNKTFHRNDIYQSR